ncbi:hypothetical protein SAMN06297129_0835 [Pseudooceanicola antarcticus]|uniref:Uncharacterized protein n=1 Tax=Pseudooceanicola antarcticus TaxID=1247613 RepID=A0A285I2A5_9RHOB|nr:hypothetical protein [Pseudooceanicola antarcticus]PJE30304.1 hypothetical protein CVM39_06230 [Pseudooceanicola antarcticus]SNY41206.1 hypothetical protein SAMN06297129_0835 [Pseudooceanicola antarcticus]
MGEAITVCESICRDFSLIWFLEPKPFQALLTLLAALIASLTALYIAICVYPRQKSLDQKLEAAREARTVCLLVHQSYYDLHKRIFLLGRPSSPLGNKSGEFRDLRQEVERVVEEIQIEADFAFSQLKVVASARVVAAGSLLFDRFWKFSIGLQANKKVLSLASEVEAQVLMRALASSAFSGWGDDFDGFIEAVRAEYGLSQHRPSR